jgi:hypothetical protein
MKINYISVFYKEDRSMKSQTEKMVWLRPLILGAIAIAVMVLWAGTLQAKTDACGLLTAAEVAPLLGGTPTNATTPKGMACTWTGSNAKRKLLILTYEERVPGGVMFMGARQGAQSQEGAKVSDESGIGDKAFSVQESFGAVFFVLKQGRVLQLQFWTGSQGTSQDVAAMRPVVKKAAAGF